MESILLETKFRKRLRSKSAHRKIRPRAETTNKADVAQGLDIYSDEPNRSTHKRLY